MVTLRQAGVNPARVASAIEKITRYNRDHLGRADNEDYYPSIIVRRSFAGEILRWLDR